MRVSGGGAASPAPASLARPDGVETEVDEFTGQTSFVLRHRMEPEGQAPRGGELTAFGMPGARPIVLMLSVPSESWRYLRCDSVHMLADGSPVAVEEARRDRGSVLGGGHVVEYVVAQLPWASVVRLAGAQVVRVRVCNDVFRFDARFTRHVNDLSQRMWEAEASADSGAGTPKRLE